MSLKRKYSGENDRILTARGQRNDKGNARWLDSEAAELYTLWKKDHVSFKYKDVDWDDLPPAQKNEFRKAAIIRRKREKTDEAKDTYKGLDGTVQKLMRKLSI